jgi:formamidopyrimidine-DNA glycosylase
MEGFRGPAGEDALLYRDIRKFGRLHVAPNADVPSLLPPAASGGDVLELSAEEFHRRIAASKAPLKAVLMDQGTVAGLGNIYATEILFEAGISPFRPAASISRPESDIIREAARSVLAEAIRLRGSTVENYRAPLGPGAYQGRHRAYGKGGGPCPRCGRPLERRAIAGRSTVFCPRCQK